MAREVDWGEGERRWDEMMAVWSDGDRLAICLALGKVLLSAASAAREPLYRDRSAIGQRRQADLSTI